MKVSCIASGATTLYFSSIVVVVVVVVVVSVTTFKVSMTLMYPSFWAMCKGVCPFCKKLRNILNCDSTRRLNYQTYHC